MPARIFGGFAVAAGGTTDIVLLTDTARVQSSQGEQLLLELGDAALHLEGGHTDSYMMAIGYCRQKNERETNHELQKKSSQPSFLLPLRSSFGHGGPRRPLACITCLPPVRLGRQTVTLTSPHCLHVDPLQQYPQLPGGNLLAPGVGKGKLKRTRLQSLVPDRPAIPVPVQNLQPVAPSVTKHQQMSAEGVTANQDRKSVV